MLLASRGVECGVSRPRPRVEGAQRPGLVTSRPPAPRVQSVRAQLAGGPHVVRMRGGGRPRVASLGPGARQPRDVGEGRAVGPGVTEAVLCNNMAQSQ